MTMKKGINFEMMDPQLSEESGSEAIRATSSSDDMDCLSPASLLFLGGHSTLVSNEGITNNNNTNRGSGLASGEERVPVARSRSSGGGGGGIPSQLVPSSPLGMDDEDQFAEFVLSDDDMALRDFNDDDDDDDEEEDADLEEDDDDDDDDDEGDHSNQISSNGRQPLSDRIPISSTITKSSLLLPKKLQPQQQQQQQQQQQKSGRGLYHDDGGGDADDENDIRMLAPPPLVPRRRSQSAGGPTDINDHIPTITGTGIMTEVPGLNLPSTPPSAPSTPVATPTKITRRFKGGGVALRGGRSSTGETKSDDETNNNTNNNNNNNNLRSSSRQRSRSRSRSGTGFVPVSLSSTLASGRQTLSRPLIRYIKSLGGKSLSFSNRSNPTAALSNTDGHEHHNHEDGDSTSEDDMTVLDTERGGVSFEELIVPVVPAPPWGEPMDWDSLPVLPISFCVSDDNNASTNSIMMPSLSGSAATAGLPAWDTRLWQTPLTRIEGDHFAWEHTILLQALLQLLSERDQIGVEASMDVSDNIWKKGPLRKLAVPVLGGRRKMRPTAGAWKLKYVELRQGNLCYFADEEGVDSDRKIIHLRQSETIVQESSYRGPGYVFELLEIGTPPRYWLASSEEERQAWIKAIQAAMIGDESPFRDVDLGGYKDSLDVYEKIRASLAVAHSAQSYVDAIQSSVRGVDSFQVPVEWVRRQPKTQQNEMVVPSSPPSMKVFPKREPSNLKRISLSIPEFWRQMSLCSYSINGFIVPKETPSASQRVMGSLTRCIMEFDKALLSPRMDDETFEKMHITELQAISYARTIFMAVLQSRDRGDAGVTIQHLLQRPDLVEVSTLSTAEAAATFDDVGDDVVRLEVGFAGDDSPDEYHPESTAEFSDWIWTSRPKNVISVVSGGSNKWKQRYVVLSGAAMSIYESANPRPHGLKFQVMLTADAVVQESGEEICKESSGSRGGGGDGSGSGSEKTEKTRFVLNVSSQERASLLAFDRKSDMLAWRDAIQLVIDNASAENKALGSTSTDKLLTATWSLKVAADGSIRSGIRAMRGAKDGGIRAMKGAKDGGIRAIKSATGGSMKVFRSAVGRLKGKSGEPNASEEVTRPRMTPVARMPSMKMLLSNADASTGRKDPTVQCIVQASQTYAVRGRRLSNSTSMVSGSAVLTTKHDGVTNNDGITSDATTPPNTPGGDKSNGSGTGMGESGFDDRPWMLAQVKWCQAFLMSGGPSGRISRGDALIEFDFIGLKGVDSLVTTTSTIPDYDESTEMVPESMTP